MQFFFCFFCESQSSDSPLRCPSDICRRTNLDCRQVSQTHTVLSSYAGIGFYFCSFVSERSASTGP